MSLVVGTVLWVSIATALVAVAAWLVDRSTARQEHRNKR